jgi:hypothetical protein
MRIRQLVDGRGQVYETRQEGCDVTVLSARKTTTRSFGSEREALAFCEKEELSRLRKGFVGRQDGFALHLGKGYTGAMVAHFHGDRLWTNQFSDCSKSDELLSFDWQGNLLERRVMPGLVWELASLGSELVVRVNHSVRIGERIFHGENRCPASFLSAAAGRLAFYAEPEVIVLEAAGREIFRRPCQPEMYSGHSLQLAGCLSADGRRLALCHRLGRVEVFDLLSGEPRSYSIPECLVQSLAFCGEQLLLGAIYRWEVGALDLASGSYRTLLASQRAGDMLVRHNEIWIPEGPRLLRLNLSGEILEERRLDYVVKRARVGIGEPGIAVRTDTGCLLLTRSENPNS